MAAGTSVTSDGSAPLAARSRGRELGWEVSDIQRMRILAAMSEVAAERGIAAATVEHVVARAGVSRRTFYELFAGLEDCFLAAFDEAVAIVAGEARPAYEAQAKWIDAIRLALHAVLGLFDERPELARVLVVESLGGGPRLVARRAAVVARLVAVVDRGRRVAGARETRAITPVTAEGVVGGALALAHTRLCGAEATRLSELAGALMSMIALPYLGVAGARRELERPPPQRRNAQQAPSDPLRELPMRVTYRTIRVLQEISANPGASNRAIGLAADIEDQGQASRLLARLRRFGLLENTRAAAARGAPNAWRLTDKGAAVLAMSGSAIDEERRRAAARDGV